jgi:hypothetical protein
MNRENLRHELKFTISPQNAEEIVSRLKNAAWIDENSNPDGSYQIHSLYFDNIYDKALREKLDGVNLRHKYRLRYYNGDLSLIRLEKKSKLNGLCRKESLFLSLEDCRLLLQGEYKFLLCRGEPLAADFYAKLQTEALRPKNIVDYRRRAFVYEPGGVRVTLDDRIHSRSVTRDFFNPKEAGIPVGGTVLEIKYDSFLPQLIADLVQTPNSRTEAFSKYAAARIF